jgi:asparaginyl-tRNA synthetase
VKADHADFELARSLHTGDCVEVEGVVVPSKGSEQAWELLLTRLVIIGKAGPEYPIQKKAHSADYLRSMPHLRARAREQAAVFRIRSALAQHLHAIYAEAGMFYVHTPIITGSDCEGAGEMFSVSSGDQPFFGQPAHLTVSGQLEGEMLALALGRIYTFGPTFRAEHSATGRHLSEFWMVEPEMAFYGLDEILDLAEMTVRIPLLRLFGSEVSRGDLEVLGRTDAFSEVLAQPSFGRITYTEAVEQLQAAGYEVQWGDDLSAECEQYLTGQHGAVFVTHWPRSLKPFYMRQDGDVVEGFDLLVPHVGELVGGSVREHEFEKLEAAMAEKGVDPAEYAQYLDSRRYGTAPHAGFGLGFDRYVQWVTGTPNIRDVIPYPRAYGQLY